jgi:serine/threonine protein phosphatase PrpC
MVQDTMHIANLGDSGIIVIRRGKVLTPQDKF